MKTYFNWFILIAAVALGVPFFVVGVLQGLAGNVQGFISNLIFASFMGGAVVYEIKQIKKKRQP